MIWRCPVTQGELTRMPLAGAVVALGGGNLAPAPRPAGPDAIGLTPEVLVAQGGRWAYPIGDDIPVLLVPERLHATGVDGRVPTPVDVHVPPYAEAYAEMAPYTRQSGVEGQAHLIERTARDLRNQAALEPVLRSAYPDPIGTWYGGADEVGAQGRALHHLAPIADQRVLQLGGNGVHVLVMLAAGASEALLVTPVLEELRWFRATARAAGFADRIAVAVGMAEELPLGDDSVDRVYSPSSIHHTVTTRSFPEAARVLAPGGRFASVDVFRSPLYGAGIKLFGKRDAGVFCKPLDADRLLPVDALPGVELSYHGAVFRYPLSIVARKGRHLSLRWSDRLARAEDALARRVPGVDRLASLVCVTAVEPG